MGDSDQLHTPYGPPPFTIQATDRFLIILNGGNACSTSQFKKLEFSDNSLNRGAWVDFLYRVKWGSANNGEIQVWRRNQGQTNFREVMNVTGVSNYKSCTSEHYFKHGFCRDKTTPHTNILHLDGFSWGKTREGVLAHVFAWHMKVSNSFHLEKFADCDYNALNCRPLSVYLSQGTHRLTLFGREAGAAIDSLTIRINP